MIKRTLVLLVALSASGLCPPAASAAPGGSCIDSTGRSGTTDDDGSCDSSDSPYSAPCFAGQELGPQGCDWPSNRQNRPYEPNMPMNMDGPRNVPMNGPQNVPMNRW